jgi:predicted DNA binding CopG/RHH family protein
MERPKRGRPKGQTETTISSIRVPSDLLKAVKKKHAGSVNTLINQFLTTLVEP